MQVLYNERAMAPTLRAAQFAFFQLLLVALAIAFVAWGKTTPVKLQDPNPLLRQDSLLLANIALVLVVLLQAVRTIVRRRKKFRVASDYGEDSEAEGSGFAADAPTPKPPPVHKPPDGDILACPNCESKIRVPAEKRPTRYRCPKCKHVGVAT